MSNFGFLRLSVVNPFDPAFREARSAVGASSVLANAEVFDNVAEAVADCVLVVGTSSVGGREMRHTVRPLDEGARIIRKRMASNRVALLFGSEKVGLTNEHLSHCHWLMRIPARQEHRSINLGQAVAISLYELARGAHAMPKIKRAEPEKDQPATANDIERVTSLLFEALRSSGSLRSRSAAGMRENVRRLILRHKLSAADAEFWLGMLRQIVWKLESGNTASN